MQAPAAAEDWLKCKVFTKSPMSPSTVTHVFDDAWFRLACRDLPLPACDRLCAAAAWAQGVLADRTLATGEPVAEHAAGLVVLLAGLQVDVSTRIAALVVSTVRDGELEGQATVAERFGQDVAKLVEGYRGLLRLGAVTRESSDAGASGDAQTEMLRKMVLAMAADLRIVFMRLASRLQTLRWHAATKVEVAESVAREALELYAPLAARLGIWQVKWEMEDLAFRFLQPVEYKRIAKLLEEKRTEREAFIAETLARLRAALDADGIKAEVSGRPKHIYSIWNKMRNKSLDFSDLYDLRAVRIIVDDIRSCYAALGLVHQLWTPVLDEYDDYVSRPKPNGYRSLHTVVADASGRPFEVQIRTREMHEFAEFGVAAHWRYKEAGAQGGKATADGEYDRRLAWIRQLLAWKNDVQDGDPSEAVDLSALDDRVYVLTPQGRVVELPAGATPVDFAYQVHTDLGHRCRGARVDGQMVSLNSHLATGQTVEIIATKAGGPSRDWLNPHLGYLASNRSRAKVRQWFNAIEMQQRISQGQALVEKELQRLGKTATSLDQLSSLLGFACPDDLYVAVSKEEFSLRQLEGAFATPTAEPEVTPESVARESRADSVARGGKSGVLVVGVDSLLTQLAKCCRPAPPDSINGFVTKGRGVSIHRADCPSMAVLAARHPERVIDVAWGEAAESVFYPVDIFVQSSDRSGLLRDISDVFARLRINVVGVNTQSKQQVASMLFTAEVSDAHQLQRALVALREVPGVSEVRRR